jgi:hypothetical protein
MALEFLKFRPDRERRGLHQVNDSVNLTLGDVRRG